MKFEKDKISCVVPTYNRIEFLEQVLYNLRNIQTYKNLEIIVVDDGSKIPCKDLADKYADKYIRLQENSGSVSIPRAIGITHSTGEFIAHIDDDIFNCPDKFSKLHESIVDSDSKLVYGNMRIFKDGLEIPGSFIKDWNPLKPNGWGVDGSQFIYRADVYKKVPLVFTQRGCDWHTARQIKKYFSEDFIHIDYVVSYYTWHRSNRSLDDTTKSSVIYPSKFADYFSSTWEHTIDFNLILK